MSGDAARSDGSAPGGILPDEPVPVRLMNTVWGDRSGVHDALTTPDDLATWLHAVGAVDGPFRVYRDDLARARRLRDALRRLAALKTADTRQAAASPIADIQEAVVEVNATAATALAAPRLHLRDGDLHADTEPVGPPVSAALSAVATEAIDLLTGTRSAQLRACNAPGCVLYFVKDHPRRAWCSTTCGNRARAARHYRRHHPAAARAAPSIL